MYDELIKRLREADEVSMCGECGLNLHTGATKKGVLFAEAADAIEKLAAFKAQITDGKFYVYKFGKLFELRNDPRDLTVKFQYPEPPKEGKIS